MLARPVLAHQARERGALVRGVVVDVHARVASPPFDEPVDESLEHRALALAVPPPQRRVADLARLVAVAVAEQVLEPPRGLVERVTLEVEPYVTLVGLRQEPEAPLRLVRQELPDVRPRPPPAELELRLVAQLLERLGPHPVRGVPLALAERLERRDALELERLGPAAPHPRHERQVVVVHALLPAQRPEVADPAVVARPPVRLRLALERREEAAAHPPVVRLELRDAERLALAPPVLHVDVLDRRTLDPRDLLRVEAELQHVRGLGAPRELRVDRLVGPVRLPLEEVGEPAPACVRVREIRLVDHVRGRRRGSPPRSAAAPPPGRSPRRRTSGSGRSSAPPPASRAR